MENQNQYLEQMAQSFKSYLGDFFQNKSNKILFSSDRLPFRMKKITFDLTAAVPGGQEWLKLNVPITGLHVERYYSKASGTESTGSVQMIFDTDTILNTANPKTLKPNDAFIMNGIPTSVFFKWSVQSDTMVDLVLFMDIDYRPGSTLSTVSGNVTSIIEGAGTFNSDGQTSNGTDGWINWTTADPFIIAANSSRRGVYLWNDGGGVALIGWNSTPTRWLTTGTFSAAGPSTAVLAPGESIFIETEGVIQLAGPSATWYTTEFGYSVGSARIGYVEVARS